MMQNEWNSAVLCKITHFSTDKQKEFVYHVSPELEANQLLRMAVCILINNKIFFTKDAFCDEQKMDLLDLKTKGFGLGRRRKLVLEIISSRNQYINLTTQKSAEYLQKILDMENILHRSRNQASIEDWVAAVEAGILSKAEFSQKEVEQMIHTYLLAKSKSNRDYHSLYVAYLTYQNDRISS